MTIGSKPEWALSQTVKLSERFTIEMTFGPGGMVCEWAPTDPITLGTTLTAEEARRYRSARNELASQMGERMGKGKVLIVET
jgi:hypothetical protein